MNHWSNALFIATLALSAPARAHSGHHADGGLASWLRHALLSPDHLLLPIVAGAAITGAIALAHRCAARRGSSADHRKRS